MRSRSHAQSVNRNLVFHLSSLCTLIQSFLLSGPSDGTSLLLCTCPLLSSSYRFSRNGSPPLVRPSFTRTSRNSNSLGVLSVQGGGISFACSEATFSMGSFTEYDHVWKLDVRGLGRDVIIGIIGIIGIICVLRAASSSTFLRAQASCQTKQSTPGVSGSARRWKVKLDLAAPGVVSDQTIDARS